MSKALDDLSKNIARGMSRRRALLLFGGSIMAVFLGDRASKTAYANTAIMLNLVTGNTDGHGHSHGHGHGHGHATHNRPQNENQQ
jgi:hypothetical protein